MNQNKMKRSEMIHFIEEAKNGIIKNPEPVCWSYVDGKFYLLENKKIEVSEKYFLNHEKETDTLFLIEGPEKELKNSKCQGLVINDLEVVILLEELILKRKLIQTK